MLIVAYAYISVMEQKHEYSHEHLEGVQMLAALLAKFLPELSAEDRENISLAALLHDIGKIAVEKSTLSNTSKQLTGTQIKELEAHTFKGVQILRKCRTPFPEMVIEGVFSHHERWDGVTGDLQGYPLGISGKRIPLAGRIIAVADTYHAMTSQREYQRKLSRVEAVAALQALAGNKLDPRLVKIFITKVIPTLDRRKN